MRKREIETERTHRYKLRKSGKTWIKIAVTKIGLLNLFKASEDQNKINVSVDTLEKDDLTVNGIRTLSVVGALFGLNAAGNFAHATDNSGNVLGERQANNDAGLAGKESHTIVNNTSANNENRETTVSFNDKEEEESTSESESTSVSESASKSASASESTSESESTSVSESASKSASASESISESESTSSSESTSTSESTSISTSIIHSNSLSPVAPKGKLANTGIESTSSTMLGALSAILGLGLFSKNRKSDKE